MIRQARQVPGEWVLALPNERVTLARSIRQRRHPDLRSPVGRLEVQTRLVYVDEFGVKRANLYVKWVVAPAVRG